MMMTLNPIDEGDDDEGVEFLVSKDGVRPCSVN